MLYTNSKLATNKMALLWFINLVKERLIEPDNILIFCGNNCFEGKCSEVQDSERFLRKFLYNVTKIVVDGTYQNHPMKLNLLIENLQNRIFVETDDEDVEQEFVKEVFS